MRKDDSFNGRTNVELIEIIRSNAISFEEGLVEMNRAGTREDYEAVVHIAKEIVLKEPPIRRATKILKGRGIEVGKWPRQRYANSLLKWLNEIAQDVIREFDKDFLSGVGIAGVFE